MFKFNRSIQLNVTGQFFAAADKLAYVNQYNKLILEEKVLAPKGGALKFFDSGNKIIYFDWDEEEYFLQTLGEPDRPKALNGCTPILSTLRNKDVILSSLEINGSDFKTHFYLGDTETFEIIRPLDKLTDFRVVGRYRDIIIVVKLIDLSISGFDLGTNEFLWTIRDVQGILITKFGDKFIIGSYLYFVVNQHAICEVDIPSGEIIRIWSNDYFNGTSDVAKASEKQNVIPFGGRNCLLSNCSKIGALNDRDYVEINLKTGETSYTYLHDYFKKEKVMPFTNSTVATIGDAIVFSSQFVNIETNQVEFSFGLFDTTTKKIASRYTFEPGEIVKGVKGPVVNDKQVFILDFDNRLHVFDMLI